MANYEEARVKLTNNQPKNLSLQQRKTIGITKKITSFVIIENKTKNQDKKCFC